MSHRFIISDRVIKTVNALPDEERKVISEALAAELIRGENPISGMSSLQAIIYSAIRYYIRRDTERSGVVCAQGGVAMGVSAV